MGSMTFASLFGSLMFGTVGFGAFVYGKKTLNWKPMAIGAGLMAYPYFFTDSTAMLYIIGIALCASLYIFRE